MAHVCVRHRFVVLAVWLLVTVALVVVSHRLGDNTNDNLSLPGTDSQRATDTLAASFPDQANGTSPIVLHASSGRLSEPRYAQAVNEAAAAVAKAPNVASVVNPLTPQGAGALSKDQSTGYLSVTLAVPPGELSTDDAQAVVNAAAPAKAAGLEVETGGQLGQKLSKPATESSEAIGIVAAMVILALTFGTVAAMLLPILNAVVALALTLAIIRMLGHVTTVPTVAPTLATMIGLGVGIDYALFVVTRHLRGLDDGLLGRGGDRALLRHIGWRGVLRRGDGHDRARLARGRRDPARDDDGPDGGHRGGHRSAGRAHVAPGGARDLPADASCRCPCASRRRATSRRSRGCGRGGPGP